MMATADRDSDSDRQVGWDEETTDYVLRFVSAKGHATLSDPTKGYITPIEMARLLGITPQVLYNYIRNDKLPYTLTPQGKKVIPLAACHEFVKARLMKADAKSQQIERELRGD